MNVTIADNLALDQWEQFINKCSSSNVFHTPQMMEVFKRTNGYDPTLLAALRPDGNVLSLVMPVNINIITNNPCKFNSRTVLYGGILFCNHQNYNGTFTRIFETYNHLNRKKNLFTEIRNTIDTSDIHECLLENDFLYEEYLNYEIDLNQPEERIFGKISRTHRQCIKKSQTFGVSVEEIHRNDIPTFFKIIQKTYSRIRIPGPDISLFESAYNILYPMNMAKFLMAFKNSEPIGALALLFHKKCAYAWYLGSNDKYFNVHPNHILIWEGIKTAKQNGCTLFDFLGAGKPNEQYGVRTFKERFGGQLTNYGRYYSINSKFAFKICKKIYPIYRKFL